MGKVRKGSEEDVKQEAAKTPSSKNDQDSLYEQLYGEEEAKNKKKERKQRRPRPKVNFELLCEADGLPLLYEKVKITKIDPENPHESLCKMRRVFEDWQRHLIPSFNFDDFLDKTESLSGNRHVKRLLQTLEEGGSIEDLVREQQQQKQENNMGDDNEGAEDEAPTKVTKTATKTVSKTAATKKPTTQAPAPVAEENGDDDWDIEDVLGANRESESESESESEEENIPLSALLVKNPQTVVV